MLAKVKYRLGFAWHLKKPDFSALRHEDLFRQGHYRRRLPYLRLMTSMYQNKPNGQFQLRFDRESIIAFMHDLPIRKVPGIGRVNERVLLETFGIKVSIYITLWSSVFISQTCGDIFKHRATISLMDKGQEFGLKFLLQTYLGIASNSVLPRQRDERKSIGSERCVSIRLVVVYDSPVISGHSPPSAARNTYSKSSKKSVKSLRQTWRKMAGPDRP